MVIRIFYIIALPIVLSACASQGNRYSAEKVVVSDISSEQGVVFFSAGAAKRCFSTATFLKLSGDNPEYNKGKPLSFNVDGYAVKSDFDSHQGSLYTLVLPQGNYYFSPKVANPYVKATRTPIFKFQLKSGERLYLGEYFMPVACRLNTQSLFVDKYERDISLLLSKNSALASDDIEKRFPEFVGER